MTTGKEVKDARQESFVERILQHKGEWLHANGTIYRVLYIGNREIDPDRRDKYPVQVVYSDQRGTIYVRPPDRFLRHRVEFHAETIPEPRCLIEED